MINKKMLSEKIREYFKDFVSEGNKFFDALQANADIQKLIDALAKEDAKKCSECSRRKFYQEGYADGVNANKWISCSERLPEDENTVLINIKTRDIEVGLYIKEYGFGRQEGFLVESSFVPVKNVLAWQPLPEPYRGAENEYERSN